MSWVNRYEHIHQGNVVVWYGGDSYEGLGCGSYRWDAGLGSTLRDSAGDVIPLRRAPQRKTTFTEAEDLALLGHVERWLARNTRDLTPSPSCWQQLCVDPVSVGRGRDVAAVSGRYDTALRLRPDHAAFLRRRRRPAAVAAAAVAAGSGGSSTSSKDAPMAGPGEAGAGTGGGGGTANPAVRGAAHAASDGGAAVTGAVVGAAAAGPHCPGARARGHSVPGRPAGPAEQDKAGAAPGVAPATSLDAAGAAAAAARSPLPSKAPAAGLAAGTPRAGHTRRRSLSAPARQQRARVLAVVEALFCPLCTSLFDDGDRVPLVLDCSHSICGACMDQQQVSQAQSPFETRVLCPTCSQEAVSSGNINAAVRDAAVAVQAVINLDEV